jgi:hypothetical protein
METLQSLAGLVGIGLGLTYIVGGLIVSLHLARYGINEYQIVRVKYLVVGLVYLLNVLVTLILVALPALALAASALMVMQAIALASLGAAVALLIFWARAREGRWRTWVILGTLALLFPMLIFLRQVLANPQGFLESALIMEAVVIGLLGFSGQVYYYARFIYGDATVFVGGIDPTGTGAVGRVRLAGEIGFLRELGIPLTNDRFSAEVALIDEMDSHYLIGIPSEGGLQAIKIDKSVIKAIQYLGYQDAGIEKASSSAPRTIRKKEKL